MPTGCPTLMYTGSQVMFMPLLLSGFNVDSGDQTHILILAWQGHLCAPAPTPTTTRTWWFSPRGYVLLVYKMPRVNALLPGLAQQPGVSSPMSNISLTNLISGTRRRSSSKHQISQEKKKCKRRRWVLPPIFKQLNWPKVYSLWLF